VGRQGNQAGGGQQDEQARGMVGYSAPEAIWSTMPAAATTRPATVRLAATVARIPIGVPDPIIGCRSGVTRLPHQASAAEAAAVQHAA
jgi:hypothetical protein